MADSGRTANIEARTTATVGETQHEDSIELKKWLREFVGQQDYHASSMKLNTQVTKQIVIRIIFDKGILWFYYNLQDASCYCLPIMWFPKPVSHSNFHSCSHSHSRLDSWHYISNQFYMHDRLAHAWGCAHFLFPKIVWPRFWFCPHFLFLVSTI